MKREIQVRISVLRPLSGVRIMVQRGRDELLAPVRSSDTAAVFEFEIMVDLAAGNPNFLGKYAQGPSSERFIYVNTGRRAGQTGSCWDRRAKISLMSVTTEQIDAILNGTGSVLSVEFDGIGRDGGPTCASVKGLEWKVAKI